MYFKKATTFDFEQFIEGNVLAYPVRPLKRSCDFVVTNCSVNENWDKLSTYDVTTELMRAFDEAKKVVDIGLCSYLAQGIVDTMWEAKMEDHSSKCDLSQIFNCDYKVSSGVIITAEEIWDVVSEYFTVVNWNEEENHLELVVKLKVK